MKYPHIGTRAPLCSRYTETNIRPKSRSKAVAAILGLSPVVPGLFNRLQRGHLGGLRMNTCTLIDRTP